MHRAKEIVGEGEEEKKRKGATEGVEKKVRDREKKMNIWALGLCVNNNSCDNNGTIQLSDFLHIPIVGAINIQLNTNPIFYIIDIIIANNVLNTAYFFYCLSVSTLSPMPATVVHVCA